MSLYKLVKKDLKIVLSDKKAFIMLIAMPLILFSILSFALAGSFTDDSNDIWSIRVGIVKEYDFEDEFEVSKKYISSDELKDLEKILFDVFDDKALDFISYEILDYDKAVSKLESDELSSVIILPEHYLSDMMMNMSPIFRKPFEVGIIRNSDQSYSSDIVENIVKSVMNQLSQMMISNKVSYETLKEYKIPNDTIDQIIEELRSMSENKAELSLQINDYQIDQLKMVTSGQYYSTAMLAMFLLFGASYGAKFMLVEKKGFTLQRQQMAGISSTKLIVGKMVIIFMIAVMQIAIMILTSALGFKVYWGEPIYVVLLTLLVALAVTGFGSILAAISLKMNSLKALNMMESGIFQIIALFGGSYFPLFLMPLWFQYTSRVLINGATLEAYQKIMMNSPFNEMIPSLISLSFNAVVFLIIGLALINRQPKNTIPREEVAL